MKFRSPETYVRWFVGLMREASTKWIWKKFAKKLMPLRLKKIMSQVQVNSFQKQWFQESMLTFLPRFHTFSENEMSESFFSLSFWSLFIKCIFLHENVFINSQVSCQKNQYFFLKMLFLKKFVFTVYGCPITTMSRRNCDKFYQLYDVHDKDLQGDY